MPIKTFIQDGGYSVKSKAKELTLTVKQE